MLLKGTRKLLATAIGVCGLVGFSIAMAIYAPGAISLTTSILSIIGITGLCGYEIRTQGAIDFEDIFDWVVEDDDIKEVTGDAGVEVE